MPAFRTVLLSAASFAAAAFCSISIAAPVSLGTAGQFNIVSFNDFISSGSAVQGAVAVADDFKVSNYSINDSNKASAGYALVVGGDASFSSGSIKNGNAYVGESNTNSSLGFSGKWVSGAAPISFSSVETQMENLSDALATLGSTGSTKLQYGGINFTGTSSAVEIFNLSASDLNSVNYANLAKLTSGSTIIFNISGSSASLSGGTLNGFANYNVLFNFYEATTLSFNGAGIYGSILAPLATVTGGNGQINGNVIVDDWNSSIAVNANHYFVTTDVAGLAAARGGLDASQAVPEPASIALFLVALGMLGWSSRKRLGLQTRSLSTAATPLR